MQITKEQVDTMIAKGMTHDQVVSEAAKRGDTLPDENSGFWHNLVGDIGTSLQGRMGTVQEATQRKEAGVQSQLSTTAQTAGAIAGGVQDVAFAPLTTAVKSITPEPVKQAISGGFDSLINSLSNTDTIKGLADFIQKNPQQGEKIVTTLKNLSAAGDVASLGFLKPTMSALGTAKTATVGGVGTVAKVPVESSLQNQLAKDIIDLAGEKTTGVSKGAVLNRSKIAGKEGVTSGPSGTLMVDEMKLPANQSIIKHASEYAVAGDPGKTVNNLVDAIDAIRNEKSTILKSSGIMPESELFGKSMFNKLYSGLADIATREGATTKAAQLMTKDLQLTAKEIATEAANTGVKMSPTEILDNAITKWKANILAKNPNAFDPTSPMGNFNKVATKKILENARDTVASTLPPDLAKQYKALHTDWYWKQEAIDNIIAKTKSYPVGTSKMAIRFDQFYQNRLKKLSTGAAALGGAGFIASSFMAPGLAQSILGGMTTAVFTGLALTGTAKIAGKVVTARTVKRALISESAKLEEMFRTAPNDVVKAKIGEAAIATLGMINVLEKRETADNQQ